MKKSLMAMAIITLFSMPILIMSDSGEQEARPPSDTSKSNAKKENCAVCSVATEIMQKFKKLYKEENSKESKFSTQTVHDSKEDLSITVMRPPCENLGSNEFVDIVLDAKIESHEQLSDVIKEQFLIPELIKKYVSRKSWKECFKEWRKWCGFSRELSINSWRTLDDCTKCQSYIFGRNGLRGWEEEKRFRCNITVPREMFNTVFHATTQKNGDAFVVQQKNEPKSMSGNTLTKENLKASGPDVAGRQFQSQECTLQDKNACYALLNALLAANQVNKKDTNDNITFEFRLPVSDKMNGYTKEDAIFDDKKHEGLPSPQVIDRCNGNASCVATWFLLRQLHLKGRAINQYHFGQDGQDGGLWFKHDDFISGSFDLSKEEFEKIKKFEI